MKKILIIGLLVSLLVMIFLFLNTKKSGYAPPRDENTVLPFIEPSKDYPAADNQSNVFIDAGGWNNMREHPLAPFIQEDATTTQSYGDFVGLESSSGDAPMYVIAADEQYSGSSVISSEYIPNITSPTIPPITVGGQQVS